MEKGKFLLAFGLSFLLLFLLAACGNNTADDATGDSGNNSASGSDSGEVTLNFWVFGATNYEELAKKYEEENPGVKIKVVTAELEDHHDSLFNALSAGSGAPDAAMLEIDQLDRFKEAQDRFVNLYDLGAGDIQDKYLDWKWEMGENIEGDFLFGLPTDIGPKAMYYRVDIFEGAGQPTVPDEVEQLIQTKEDFLKVGEQIKEKTGKPMVDSMEMAYRAIIDGAEQSFFDEDGNLLIEDEKNAVRQAFNFAVDMNERGLVGEYELWSPEWGNAVENGDFAVEMGAAWLKGWMEGNAPDAEGQFRVATLPVEFAGNWGGSYIAIPEESNHPEETYAFIEWLVSPENQLESFKSVGLFPSSPEVYEMEEFKNISDEFFGGQNTAQYFAKAAEDIPFVYKGPKYVVSNNEILAALTDVQQGEVDPDSAWDVAVERIKAAISR